MLMNLWKNIELCCGEHDDAPTLKVMGERAFYACPRYMLKDDNHPDGHAADEKMCKNAFSFNEIEKAVMKFIDIVEGDMREGVICDYTGYVFTCDSIKVKVLEQRAFDFVSLGLSNGRTLNS